MSDPGRFLNANKFLKPKNKFGDSNQTSLLLLTVLGKTVLWE